MASGKNHDLSILVCTPIVGILSSYYTLSLELAIIASSAHLLGGFYLSPDLDLRSKPYKRWGWLRWIWIPYQKSIPHRSFLSHAPILGTTLRLGYLTTFVLAFCYLGWIIIWSLFPDSNSIQIQLEITWKKAIVFLVALELSALNHLLLDGLLIPLPKKIKEILAKGK
jgi:uncharacterized metal-binding protein